MLSGFFQFGMAPVYPERKEKLYCLDFVQVISSRNCRLGAIGFHTVQHDFLLLFYCKKDFINLIQLIFR